MPILDSAFIARDFKKDILKDAIDGIDPAFQQQVEAELATMTNNAGTLNTTTVPTLVKLDQCIQSLCNTYRQFELNNIPENIVAFIQARINLLSLATRLQTVFIDGEDWTPTFSYLSESFATIDDDFSDDEFEIVNMSASMLGLNPKNTIVIKAETPSPHPLERSTSDVSSSLSLSVSSLPDLDDLQALSKELQQKEDELKSSQEDLSRSAERFAEHMKSTGTVMSKLIAQRHLHGFNAKYTGAKFMKSQEDKQRYIAQSYQNISGLAQVFNSRLSEAQKAAQKEQELQQKIATLTAERDYISHQILSKSCPASYFAKPAAPTPVDMHQSMIMLPGQNTGNKTLK